MDKTLTECGCATPTRHLLSGSSHSPP